MDESGIATSVARAIATAMDWTSSPDARAAAFSYLETVSFYSKYKSPFRYSDNLLLSGDYCSRSCHFSLCK